MMTFELPPFVEDAPCPKCGSSFKHITHRSLEGFTAGIYKNATEALSIKCGRCGYAYLTKTKDAAISSQLENPQK